MSLLEPESWLTNALGSLAYTLVVIGLCWLAAWATGLPFVSVMLGYMVWSTTMERVTNADAIARLPGRRRL